MKRWRLTLALLLTLAAVGATALLWKTRHAEALDEHLPVPSGVVFKKGLPYCQAGGQTLKLDWAEPEDRSTARPAVVLIHGGAWMFGQRSELRSLQFMLAQNGFVAVSVDYRLAPQAVFPQPLHDLQCAVRWLRSQAAAQAIAPAQISAWGHSAGAHLAAMLAVTAHRADLQGPGLVIAETDSEKPNNSANLRSSHVHAVIAQSGIYDLVAALDPTQALPLEARRGAVALAGGDNVESLRAASIASFVHPQAAPVLLLHGDQDRIAPLSQALQLHDVLRAQGAQSQLRVVPGAGHNDLGRQAPSVMAEVVAFLKQVRR
ncbi:MAG: alpha/beta hydrolase [Rhizobacter sp.]